MRTRSEGRQLIGKMAFWLVDRDALDFVTFAFAFALMVIDVRYISTSNRAPLSNYYDASINRKRTPT